MDHINILVLGYALGVNVLGFLIMGIDKYKAKHQKYRIQEKTLWLISFLGGCFGTTLGMYTFHHKNRKFPFYLGFPGLCILYIALIYVIMVKL